MGVVGFVSVFFGWQPGLGIQGGYRAGQCVHAGLWSLWLVEEPEGFPGVRASYSFFDIDASAQSDAGVAEVYLSGRAFYDPAGGLVPVPAGACPVLPCPIQSSSSVKMLGSLFM